MPKTATKTAHINARVDPRLKAKAEKILSKVGVSTTEAITMLLHQIVLRNGLPFEARIPNAETIAAMREFEAGLAQRHQGSARAVFDRILKESE